jgi:hypothetical protein
MIMRNAHDWDDEFDPDEIADIGEMLDVAQHKIENGYEIGFQISEYDAELLVSCWEDATSGDTTAVYMLMAEMGKLIEVLKEVVWGDEPDWDGQPE